MRRSWLLPTIVGLSLTGCLRIPQGPNVMVLPGTGKDFRQFVIDEQTCRQWAAQQVGGRASQAASSSAVAGAAVGTVLGGATGAALGAAAGNPAMGAAAGAGAGLFGGSMVGATDAGTAQMIMQRRYDIAYAQCMYAKGNQIPVPRGSEPRSTWQAPTTPTPVVPPPPRGVPPPPPPGVGGSS
jgi:hypothetical protein